MAITNPDHKTNLFGFNIPNFLLYGLVVISFLIIMKIGNVFSNLIRSIKTMFGFPDEDEATKQNSDEIEKTLKKDDAVKSQVTTQNRILADQIYNACNKFWLDDDALYGAFKQITGPNQMKAVFLCYGTRTVVRTPLWNFDGKLDGMLRWRLDDGEWNKNLGTEKVKWSIKIKLNWLKT